MNVVALGFESSDAGASARGFLTVGAAVLRCAVVVGLCRDSCANGQQAYQDSGSRTYSDTHVEFPLIVGRGHARHTTQPNIRSSCNRLDHKRSRANPRCARRVGGINATTYEGT